MILNLALIADMMDWNGGGWFWMALMMIVGAIVVVLLIFFLVRTLAQPGARGGQAGGETPLDIAKRRYAAGEISSEEFENIKRYLEKSG